MLLQAILIFSSLNFGCDTLRLPLFNGQVQEESVLSAEPSAGLLIKPISDSIVRSCSDGRVVTSDKMDSIYIILIKTDSLYYSYAQLDSSFVLKDRIVKKGEPLGLKKGNGVYTTLAFAVCRYDKKSKTIVSLGNIKRFLTY